MLSAYWNIGRLIVEDEQKNQERAQYGEQTLKHISKRLKAELGSGFSLTNLKTMRRFFLVYRKSQTLSDQLSWSHYCELLTISDDNKRSFYEKECIASKWSVRELKRQLDSSLYERLLLSRGKENKKEVKRLAEKGQEIEKPEDILKDPYVFEFVGLSENKPIMEDDLEYRHSSKNGKRNTRNKTNHFLSKGILRSLMKSFCVCNSVFAMKSMKLSSFPFPSR